MKTISKRRSLTLERRRDGEV